MPHYITTHNAAGQSVFSDRTSTDTIARNYPGSDTTSTLLFSTHRFPADPSTEADLDQYAHDREHGFEHGAICPPNGTSVFIVDLAPNEPSPMHRTMTIDTIVIIEGVIELHLDSAEKKTLRAGDSIVQRATMHQWLNVTPNDGWAKMVAFASATVDPVKVGGEEVRMEFKV